MIVVADTSVFLNLGCIRQEELLPALYGDVFAPPEVHHEFLNAVQNYPRFRELIFPAWVRLQSPAQPLSQLAPWAQLDPGESAAIALASELHADLLLPVTKFALPNSFRFQGHATNHASDKLVVTSTV